jgi:hypothetical protein
LLGSDPEVMWNHKERRYKMSSSPNQILPSLSNVVRLTAVLA